MNNSQLPAMPQNNSETLCKSTGTPNPMHSGLTKREHFALELTAAILANPEMEDSRLHLTPKQRVHDIVVSGTDFADALLKHLEETS